MPSVTVNINPIRNSWWLLASNLWWAHVTVTPDDKRTAVFSKGTANGFRGVIPVGGHIHPSSGVGASLLWKNAQKNAKKNITSDVMNKIIPHSIPRCTLYVWNPVNDLSRITSRHHMIIFALIRIRVRGRRYHHPRWNHLVIVNIRSMALADLVKGHGLCSTKWNGL